jgi:hypothetical protein
MPSARARQSQPSRAKANIMSFLLAMAAWCMAVPAGREESKRCAVKKRRLQKVWRWETAAAACCPKQTPVTSAKGGGIRRQQGSQALCCAHVCALPDHLQARSC